MWQILLSFFIVINKAKTLVKMEKLLILSWILQFETLQLHHPLFIFLFSVYLRCWLDVACYRLTISLLWILTKLSLIFSVCLRCSTVGHQRDSPEDVHRWFLWVVSLARKDLVVEYHRHQRTSTWVEVSLFSLPLESLAEAARRLKKNWTVTY